MRNTRFICLLLPILFAAPAVCQQTENLLDRLKPNDVWQRISTSDDSITEMNTAVVTWGESGNETIGRVVFRTTYDKPTKLSPEAAFSFKTELYVVELNCTRRGWRTHESRFLDDDGKVVHSRNAKVDARWKIGLTVGSQYVQAGCNVILKNNGGVLIKPPIPVTTPYARPTLKRRQPDKPNEY